MWMGDRSIWSIVSLYPFFISKHRRSKKPDGPSGPSLLQCWKRNHHTKTQSSNSIIYYHQLRESDFCTKDWRARIKTSTAAVMGLYLHVFSGLYTVDSLCEDVMSQHSRYWAARLLAGLKSVKPASNEPSVYWASFIKHEQKRGMCKLGAEVNLSVFRYS